MVPIERAYEFAADTHIKSYHNNPTVWDVSASEKGALDECLIALAMAASTYRKAVGDRQDIKQLDLVHNLDLGERCTRAEFVAETFQTKSASNGISKKFNNIKKLQHSVSCFKEVSPWETIPDLLSGIKRMTVVIEEDRQKAKKEIKQRHKERSPSNLSNASNTSSQAQATLESINSGFQGMQASLSKVGNFFSGEPAQ